ncbi:hypothetical protein BH11PSE10_BH11PSE10_00280 [soil metagenome]
MNKALAAICTCATTTILGAATPPVPSTLELALRDEFRPTITRAIDVVNEGSPRQVNAGEDVVFSVRNGAEAVLKEGFQVRIFPLPSLSSDPVEAGRAIEDCLVYFSTVYPIASTPGPKIQLITNAAEGWLSVQGDKTIGNGYYLLVFERTGVQESVFRIKRGDAPLYFATGIKLVIKATSKSRLEEIIARNANREALRATDAGKLTMSDKQIPCYRYEKVTKFAGLSDAPQQLVMAACTNAAQRS